jgi:outer membrane protein, heavy metal efflux system
MRRLGLWLALGCLACVRYEPKPLEPARHATALRARSLDDAALLAAVSRSAGRPADHRWTDRQLGVAALQLRSDLRRLRAEWRAAQAAVRTAGARPGIGANAELERRVGGRDEGSPWVVAVGALFAVELGGKRGARVQASRAAAAMAEATLLAAAWDAASEARRAAGDLLTATAETEEAEQEVRLLEEVHELERARFAEGAIGASDLARTSSDIQDARLALAGARNATMRSRAELARALAVPVRAVEELEVSLATPDGCAAVDSASAEGLAASAVAGRQEVALALSRYAVAESRLRLEVARQYPDLELGPGFIWDQGVNRWTLALALPGLLGSRNRPAIVQADAAREVAALEVAEAQDGVLADIESAIQACRGATLELVAADSVAAAAHRVVDRERAAYERGETTRLEPARADLQLRRAERALRSARLGRARAGLELERAAGASLTSANRWPDPRLDPEEEATSP